jgi:4-hydroxy-2-oxoglutarate aldolase
MGTNQNEKIKENNMNRVDLNGIFPPIPTPFVNGKVSEEKLTSNIDRWCETGIKGIVVLGSNGEAAYLSSEEKRRAVKATVDAASKEMVIIAGTGCESTVETLRLTDDCAKLGAHAALVLPPNYYAGQMNEAALTKHYTTLADDAAIPILLYNVPKFTGIALSPNMVAELSGHSNIAGIKDSSGNVAQLGEMIHTVNSRFSVLVGTAGVLFAGLCLGCSGGILALANVAPVACVSIFNGVKERDFEAARTLQLKMIALNKAVTATFGVSGLKAALDMLGYFGGDPRPPLLPAGKAEREAVKGLLEDAGLLGEIEN